MRLDVGMPSTKLLDDLKHLRNLGRRLDAIQRDLDGVKMLQGHAQAERVRAMPAGTALADVEFQVFSQFGEDGILQHLVHHVKPANRTFVEFGVEDYTEANTRFLVRHDNWRGLVIDGSDQHINTIKRDRLYAFHDLTAVAAFIDASNINSLISSAGFSGPLGILSVDIDGNDYWVWKAIDTVVPDIVVAEYNSVLGCSREVSVPYDPSFVRQEKHHSFLYFGASLPALCQLAETKGYAFVGSNSAGVNAFFVRREKLGSLRPLTASEGYVESTVRESRDEQGRLSFVSGKKRRALIASMPLVDVVTGESLRVGDLVD